MSTPTIKGFHSRADLGLRKPESRSMFFFPERGGVTLHYGGPAQKITNHNQCKARWKSWQDYHMDTHGWVDIAYTGGFCDHGYAFAGRGAFVRTAANGTNAGNDGWYAVTWIGGHGETPTPAALRAAAWWVKELRDHGRAGPGINNHSDHKNTACAGDPLRLFIAGGYVSPTGPNLDAHVPAPPPVDNRPKAPAWPLKPGYYFGYKSGDKYSISGYYSHRADLKRWQEQMIRRGWKRVPGTGQPFVADGLFGDDTAAVALEFSREKGLMPSRRVGRTVWSAAWTSPIT